MPVDGTKRMQILIDGLLECARVDMDGTDFKPVDCAKVLNQVLINLQIAIEESNTVVTYGPLPTIVANAPQLIQLFQNLIGNAIRFRSEDFPRIQISFTIPN